MRTLALKRLKEFIAEGHFLRVRTKEEMKEQKAARLREKAQKKREALDTPFMKWLMAEHKYSRRVARGYQTHVDKGPPEERLTDQAGRSRQRTGAYKAALNKWHQFQSYGFLPTEVNVAVRTLVWLLVKDQYMSRKTVISLTWGDIRFMGDLVGVCRPGAPRASRYFERYTEGFEALRVLREWACPWDADYPVLAEAPGLDAPLTVETLIGLTSTPYTEAQLRHQKKLEKELPQQHWEWKERVESDRQTQELAGIALRPPTLR
jgi:hypothetical protein